MSKEDVIAARRKAMINRGVKINPNTTLMLALIATLGPPDKDAPVYFHLEQDMVPETRTAEECWAELYERYML